MITIDPQQVNNEYTMPTPTHQQQKSYSIYSNRELTSDEIEVLKKWIEENEFESIKHEKWQSFGGGGPVKE